ncbi:MAG: SLC13 family permease [Chitinophagales bacterium]|nr:SLC13 family permease [Chitinophagales bacterium]MDW8426926.1 SLC13 family permease [Chitinophagales bacterium]
MENVGWQVYLVIAVITLLLIGLWKEWLRPTIMFLVCVVIFNIAGILKPRELLDGFANEQIAVVIMLVILGDVIQRTGVLDALFYRLFMKYKTFKGFLGRMMAFVGITSAFLNNTPIVAILIPYVNEWAKRNHVSPSKLLIPLSYLTIVGGMITLIGTSTNLIASGILVENKQPPLSFFSFTPVGIPVFIAIWIYFYFFGHKLLPDRKPAVTEFKEQARNYLTEYRITKNSPLAGKSIEESGLRHLEDVFLVEILRDHQRLAAPEPSEILQHGDRLVFAGKTSGIARLLETIPGLEPATLETEALNGNIRLRECVIPYNSNLVGKKVNESDFRAQFDAAIVGVHRNGVILQGSIGEMVLQNGDLLLVIAGGDFESLTKDKADIYVLPGIKEVRQVDRKKVTVLTGLVLAAILVGAVGILPLFQSLLVTFCLLLLLKVITVKELRKGLDLDLLAILAFSLATGKAIGNSGAANLFAQGIVNLTSPLGIVGIMLGLYIVTNFLTNIMANAASVAITLPIAIAAAATLGNPSLITPFALAIAFAGSAAFLTPIGYQTNMMVFGPGSYKFSDYFKAGWPVTIIYGGLTILIISILYGL